MTAFPALLLAVVLTYASRDVYRPFVPELLAYSIDLLICVVVFRLVYNYLNKLKG